MINIEEENAIMRPISKESQIVVNSSQKLKGSHEYSKSKIFAGDEKKKKAKYLAAS